MAQIEQHKRNITSAAPVLLHRAGSSGAMLHVHNHLSSGSQIHIGNANVTSADGYVLDAAGGQEIHAQADFYLPPGMALYAICASGQTATASVLVIEL